MKQEKFSLKEAQLILRHLLGLGKGLRSHYLLSCFLIMSLNLPVASATTLTEAATLLNIHGSGEVNSLVSDAAKLLRDYDVKKDMPIIDGVSRQKHSTGVDENVIPFLSNLVESVAHRKVSPENTVSEKVLIEKIVVKREPIVIRRTAKVYKLPRVKQWAGLHRTQPTVNYSQANTLVKKIAVAKPTAVSTALPE
jgi:hypothetical protein